MNVLFGDTNYEEVGNILEPVLSYFHYQTLTYTAEVLYHAAMFDHLGRAGATGQVGQVST